MPFGFKEVEGIHSRTNFDLSQHAKYSGKKIEYFDPETNESYTPYVIETSIGVDRMFLSIMCHSYEEEKLENGETRVVLKLPEALAPVKLAVMPLVKKDGLPEKAHEIISNLRFHFNCKYDEKDSIGKRYRRQDAIGTPYCVTVDYDTLKDNTVTLRHRDTMEQKRVNIADLQGIIEDRVSITSLLKKDYVTLPKKRQTLMKKVYCIWQSSSSPCVPWGLARRKTIRMMLMRIGLPVMPSILLKSLPKPVIPLPGQRDSMANVGKNIATGVCSNRRPSRRMRPGR